VTVCWGGHRGSPVAAQQRCCERYLDHRGYSDGEQHADV
jgi:hypothetical protein